MKSQLAKITLFSLVAAALVSIPVASRAEDATNAPDASATTPAPAKKKGGPFHGKIAAVDATAMTFAVGKMTIAVTSETKFKKDGQPATFADLTVGEMVGGAYKKDAEGKLNAVTVVIGAVKKKQAE